MGHFTKLVNPLFYYAALFETARVSAGPEL